jgi:transcriptional regulator with XRE-family HTH domain
MARADLNVQTVEALSQTLGIDSYAELARRAKMDRTLVSRILRGDRPALPSHVIALATALKVPPIVLLGPSDPDAALASLTEGDAA